MFRKTLLALLTLALIICAQGIALAESCPNITGDWDMVFEGAFIDAENNFGYMEMSGIIHVADQNGCLFYGNIEIPSNPESGCPVTGVITSGKIITMTSCDSILNGKIYGANKKMKFTLSNIERSGNDWQGTGSGIAIKKK